MKKAIFTTAALAIGAGLVGGSAVAASAATPPAAPAASGGLLGLMSPTKVTPAVVPRKGSTRCGNSTVTSKHCASTNR